MCNRSSKAISLTLSPESSIQTPRPGYDIPRPGSFSSGVPHLTSHHSKRSIRHSSTPPSPIPQHHPLLTPPPHSSPTPASHLPLLPTFRITPSTCPNSGSRAGPPTCKRACEWIAPGPTRFRPERMSVARERSSSNCWDREIMAHRVRRKRAVGVRGVRL